LLVHPKEGISMKKNHIALLAISGLFALGSMSSVLAYSASNTMNITMTVFAAGFISVTNVGGGDSTVDGGSIVVNNTNVWLGTSGIRGIFRNNGTGIENFSLKGSIFTNGNPAAFTFVTTKPAATQLRAGVIFGQWDLAYVPVDFQATDCLSTSYVLASATAFAKDSDAAGLKGVGVGSGTDRNVLFGICYGGGLTDGGILKVKLYVKAQ
jgi:hypothetical protein